MAHSKHDKHNGHARALHIDEFATSFNAAHTPLGRQLPSVWAKILIERWILEQNAKNSGCTVKKLRPSDLVFGGKWYLKGMGGKK
jgi:hypothetical protein